MDRHRESGKLVVDRRTYTATPSTRHDKECKYFGVKNASSIGNCTCPKAILVYDSGSPRTVQEGPNAGKPILQWRLTKEEGYHTTRSQAAALEAAEAWLDKFDPVKIEVQKQEAAKITVLDAIKMFLQQKNRDVKRIGNYEMILGGNVEIRKARKNNKLIQFLERQNPPVKYIADVTHMHLAGWLNSWNVQKPGTDRERGQMGDLTAHNLWGNVIEFFNYCVKAGWLTKNPTLAIVSPKYSKANRTSTFTDEQYGAILTTAQTEKGDDARRLEAFLQLMRWSGMALVDAVLFRPSSLDANNVLRYNREKTKDRKANKGRAIVQLPEDVADLLRRIPIAEHCSSNQPFRRTNLKLHSDKGNWRIQLQNLFAQAGVTSVDTDTEKGVMPHPHMLRDTCAVFYLNAGLDIYNIAMILGDDVRMVEQHYLPFVKSIEETHIAKNAAILKYLKEHQDRIPAQVLEVGNQLIAVGD